MNEQRLSKEGRPRRAARTSLHMIETPRLILRPFKRDDRSFASMNVPEVMRYIGAASPQTRANPKAPHRVLDHWDQKGFGLCAVVAKATRGSPFCGCSIWITHPRSKSETGSRSDLGSGGL